MYLTRYAGHMNTAYGSLQFPEPGRRNIDRAEARVYPAEENTQSQFRPQPGSKSKPAIPSRNISSDPKLHGTVGSDVLRLY